MMPRKIRFLLIVFSFCYMQLSVGAPSGVVMAIPPIEWPQKITQKMFLGKKLFFEKGLSINSEISCSSCHQFDLGGSVSVSKPVQFDGNFTLYNSPSIFNIIQDYKIGWIGQFDSAEHHLARLLSKKDEMGFDWPVIKQRLMNDEIYVKAFSDLYDDGLTKANLIDAIVAYENVLTTPSSFDEYLKGNGHAISASAKKGFEVFKRYGCITCHQGKNVGGNLMQKLGVFIPYQSGSLTVKDDQLGRYALTKDKADLQVFRVPSLRNVTLTAPYLHDGSIKTLPAVVSIMAKYQLGKDISNQDIELIIDFLKTLNGTPHPELLP